MYILTFGAGEIPNSAFTTTSTSAHLAVTTPFPVDRCVVSLITGEFNCAPTTPITFDLTWVRNGVETVFLNEIERTTFGPVRLRSQGHFNQLTATVNGIWDGHITAADLTGGLGDTRGTALIREVTMEANP